MKLKHYIIFSTIYVGIVDYFFEFEHNYMIITFVIIFFLMIYGFHVTKKKTADNKWNVGIALYKLDYNSKKSDNKIKTYFILDWFLKNYSLIHIQINYI